MLFFSDGVQKAENTEIADFKPWDDSNQVSKESFCGSLFHVFVFFCSCTNQTLAMRF
jgi:hypothetical protein